MVMWIFIWLILWNQEEDTPFLTFGGLLYRLHAAFTAPTSFGLS